MIFVYLLVVDAAGLWGWLDTLAGDEVASALPLTLAIGIGFWVSDDTAWRRPRWTLLPSAIVMATPWVIGQNDWWLLGAWPAAAKLAMVPLLLASWLVPWLEADRRWLLRQPHDTDRTSAGTPGVSQC